jgi:hypothetical protein
MYLVLISPFGIYIQFLLSDSTIFTHSRSLKSIQNLPTQEVCTAFQMPTIDKIREITGILTFGT